MVCPLGRVKASAQPFTVVVLVLVMVIDAVRPVSQALTVYPTRHAPAGAGVLGEGLVDVEAVADGEPGVDWSRPKN